MAVEHELVACEACENRGILDGARCEACNGQGFVRVKGAPEPEPEAPADFDVTTLTAAQLRQLAKSIGLTKGLAKMTREQLLAAIAEQQARLADAADEAADSGESEGGEESGTEAA